MPTARPTSLVEEAVGAALVRNEVLITRPAAEAAATAALLRTRGWSPVIASLLDVRPAAPVWSRPIDAIVVTSGNALPALATALASFRHLPMFAVGDATARRARDVGFLNVDSAGGDAGDLAPLIQSRVPPGATLAFPTAEGEGMALTERLRSLGYDVQRRIAYLVGPVTQLPPAATVALQSGTLHAALFLSARTARTFVELLPAALHPALAGIQAIAIGQPAADRLTLLPWGRVRVSLAPTLDQVLALL